MFDTNDKRERILLLLAALSFVVVLLIWPALYKADQIEDAYVDQADAAVGELSAKVSANSDVILNGGKEAPFKPDELGNLLTKAKLLLWFAAYTKPTLIFLIIIALLVGLYFTRAYKNYDGSHNRRAAHAC